MKNLNRIKNSLLKYSLADIEGNFENLTRREKSIVRNQETLDLLIADLAKEEPDDELEFID